MNVRTILLSFGYAESQRYSYLAVSRKEGFDGFASGEEAVKAFYADSLKCYLDIQRMNDGERRSCTNPKCKRNGAKLRGPYCSACGQEGKVVLAFDREEVAQFITELDGTADSTGGEVWEAYQERGWDLGDTQDGDAVSVDCADRLFRGDLYDLARIYTFRISDHEKVPNLPVGWAEEIAALVIPS